MSVEEQAQAEEQAAFESSFISAPAVVEAPDTAPDVSVVEVPPVAKEEEAAPVAPSPTPSFSADEINNLRAAVSRMPELETSLRKANGRIGELNDRLLQAAKSKEADGKPAALTKVELKRLKAEFPELGASLEEDISEVMSSLQARSPEMDPRVSALVGETISKERVSIHVELLDGLSPGWSDIIGLPDKVTGVEPKTEYRKWLSTQSPEFQQKLKNSNNAFEIGSSIKAFQEAKSKQGTSKQKSKERLEAALTPQGVSVPGQVAISDEDAANTAFLASFNT